MQATVPKSLVDREYELFPEGFFSGEISQAEVREDNENGRARLRVGLVNTAGLGENAPDTNGRAFSGEIPIVWDGKSITEIDDFSDPNVPFPLRLGAGLLAGLGAAVGAGTRTDDGGVVVDFAEFLPALRSGTFESDTVAFEVQHRSYETEDDNGETVERTTDEIRRFAPAS